MSDQESSHNSASDDEPSGDADETKSQSPQKNANDYDWSEYLQLDAVLETLEKIDEDQDRLVSLGELRNFASFYGRRKSKLEKHEYNVKKWKCVEFSTIVIAFLVAGAVFALVIAGIEIMKDMKPQDGGILQSKDGEIVQMNEAMDELSLIDIFSLELGELPRVTQIGVTSTTSYERLGIAHWTIGKDVTSNTTAYSFVSGTKLEFPQIEGQIQKPLLFVEGDQLEIDDPSLNDWFDSQNKGLGTKANGYKGRKAAAWTSCLASTSDIDCVEDNICAAVLDGNGDCSYNCAGTGDSRCYTIEAAVCKIIEKDATC